ncbi:poly-beta-1,6-N-acetyl-D-glucosamine synthase [Burkholderia multivorans]|uniref:poly-beta-1,6-N-acetyl-D-glucosamine synthase n=1 Tax=Burkholderia multivorans TaxID=87883 RepID=UPI0028651F69|nr:poly-beta-1,6-N-acetyl-D-glucosamine synthase [Burkholderia multivorans]MDR8873511.1 Poly-beta-1,6-N-acetyl-D-glucosamine synthase [Burkholderia multivorans]MDR8891539.1 Poly-beta-1,6-N-acetyl-D-glucosamine synthase [Burkholderia multivorans]MDR8913809.1 Poly-beta-1,6-N-acetyl-D-glucosamine synthase [Burkholderia multivorans]MDR8932151.1 Poly-beta-1,6-N-acetyl-D-glucosamine synthase [Burkholderia multivorans]MDR8939540.1 Poly-beta-1,6-N-acetyl-D-glucosamine synthase [Burkholderia multivoran
MTTHGLITKLQDFVFYYPFFMSYPWMIGGVVHYFLLEEGRVLSKRKIAASGFPKVSIVVPCFNEEANARSVIEHLNAMDYPNYDIIAVNDGSKDRTGEILNQLAVEIPRLLVIHHARNEGKAVGLTTAAAMSNAEYLLCIDGDSLLGHDAIEWMLDHFLTDPGVGAVTGNPRIRTRTSLLGRMQVGEFSSIVGLIKRTQQVYGRIFTVSGVITMFRKTALADVGFWSTDMLTEDIDISWKLQCSDWRVVYEPHALSWILMPETVKGLYRQRLRWAKGGIQVLIKYAGALAKPTRMMMWPLFIEYLIGIAWAYAMSFILLLALVDVIYPLPPSWHVSVVPHWHGMLLVATCILQLIIGSMIDRRYDEKLLMYFLDTVWYPVAFWLISMITTVVALPAVVLRGRGKRAVWVSPDRGIQHEQRTDY